jgi:hypothetical protein
MTTRITNAGPTTGVVATPTAARVTPAPTRPFSQIVNASENAIVGGAEAAVQRLPGGPVFAAAFRPGSTPEVDGTAGTMSAEGSTGTDTSGASLGATSSTTPSVDGTLAQAEDQNMYYLELQERISAQDRQYTALSNVLKARDDTIKNSISNIR